jgi:hypothetical protein
MSRERRELDPKIIKDIIRLVENGETKIDIAKNYRISVPTLNRILRENMPEKSEDEEEEEKPDAVMQPTMKKFMGKFSDSFSEVIRKEAVNTLDSAKVIKHLQAEYESPVNAMGLSWSDFLDFAVKLGYKAIYKAYTEKLKARMAENSLLEMEIEDKLGDEQ